MCVAGEQDDVVWGARHNILMAVSAPKWRAIIAPCPALAASLSVANSAGSSIVRPFVSSFIQEAPVALSIIVLIVGAVLALPGGLFAASLMSQPRTRWLGLIGGVIGAVITAFALYYFIHAAGVTIDAVSWFFGSFLACSMGVAIGALLVGFFTGSGRGSDVRAQEP
jgi:hypothetical protein